MSTPTFASLKVNAYMTHEGEQTCPYTIITAASGTGPLLGRMSWSDPAGPFGFDLLIRVLDIDDANAFTLEGEAMLKVGGSQSLQPLTATVVIDGPTQVRIRIVAPGIDGEVFTSIPQYTRATWRTA